MRSKCNGSRFLFLSAISPILLRRSLHFTESKKKTHKDSCCCCCFFKLLYFAFRVIAKFINTQKRCYSAIMFKIYISLIAIDVCVIFKTAVTQRKGGDGNNNKLQRRFLLNSFIAIENANANKIETSRSL